MFCDRFRASVCIKSELKAEIQRLILVRNKRSHVSCHKADKMVLQPTTRHVEMPIADKPDTVPFAVGQACMKNCSKQSA